MVGTSQFIASWNGRKNELRDAKFFFRYRGRHLSMFQDGTWGFSQFYSMGMGQQIEKNINTLNTWLLLNMTSNFHCPYVKLPFYWVKNEILEYIGWFSWMKTQVCYHQTTGKCSAWPKTRFGLLPWRLGIAMTPMTLASWSTWIQSKPTSSSSPALTATWRHRNLPLHFKQDTFCLPSLWEPKVN